MGLALVHFQKYWLLTISLWSGSHSILYATQTCTANVCRDSAGGFCDICRENPVIYTYFPYNPCNPVNITGFSLQILQKTPCRVPAIPCKYLQCAVYKTKLPSLNRKLSISLPKGFFLTLFNLLCKVLDFYNFDFELTPNSHMDECWRSQLGYTSLHFRMKK